MATTRRAVLDFGSNALKLVVCELEKGAPPRTLLDLERITAMGQPIVQGGELDDDAVQRTVQAADELLEQARELEPESLDAVGTWALRQCINPEALADPLMRRHGVRLRILSPTEEAVAGYLGVRAEAGASRRLAVLDLGGGSAELTIGKGHSIKRGVSLELGARQLLRAVPLEPPVPAAELKRVRDEARARLRELEPLTPKTRLVLTGGAATTLAAHLRILEGEGPQAPLPARINRKQLELLVEHLAGLSVRQRGEVPGVPPGREDVILHGALALQAAMKRLGARKARISTAGLPQGLLEAERVGMPLNPEVIQVLLPSREFYPLTRSDRTGEVLFALRRSDGRIWLQTKHSYPEGIFRIPGGGVNIGEDPHEAVFREIAEETGFHASRPILLDRFAYTGPDGSEIHWFSDLYLADIGDHEPVPEDTTEGISGWHAADPTTEITRHIRLLEGLQGPQHPWGIFRAAALVRLRERANGLRLP